MKLIRLIARALPAALLFFCGRSAPAQLAEFVPGQLQPPSVAPNGSATPAYMAQAPIDPAVPDWQPLPYSNQPYAFPLYLDETQPVPPGIAPPPKPAGRDGMLQRFTFLDSWLPKIGPQGQSNEDIELNALLGIPIPSRESPILLKPAFEAHFWSGLNDPSLPSNLYDAYLDVLWMHNWSECYQTILGASPGWHGDGKSSDEEALRVQILAVLNYTYSPTMKYVIGAKYLDRDDVLVLPIAGFVWTPSEDQEWNLVFPQPKISYRVCCSGSDEYWLAVGGELGGGIWGMEHTDGSLDVVTTRDYRVYIGIDHKTTGCLTTRLELGYVFSRIIEFQSGLPDIKPADTMLVRVGILY